MYKKYKNMELQERINILKQGAELAQKNGALTLKDAYYAKLSLEALKTNPLHKEALEILVRIANTGQKNGVYSLNDAYLLYMATDNIEGAIAAATQPPVVQAPPPVETTAAPVENKKKPKTKTGSE